MENAKITTTCRFDFYSDNNVSYRLLGEPRKARALYLRAAGLCELVLSAAHAQTKHARTRLQSIDEELGASGVAQDEARAADIRQARRVRRRARRGARGRY